VKGRWPEVTLEELCRFEQGKSPTLKTEPGEFPLVVTASYRRSSAEYQFDEPAVCIPLISSTGHGNAALHRVHYQEGKFALANLLVAAIPRPGAPINTKFLWRYLSAVKDKKLVPLMQGTANVSLKESDLIAVTIPLPPVAEQQLLVAHLDAIESRLMCAQKLREEAINEGQAFTISLHHHFSKGRVRALASMLQLDEEQEPVRVDGSYPQVGIRSFGQGMFRKSPTLGSETTYRSFNILRAGKLAMSQVKGWEGAVAVCPAELDGWFVSPEYRTFSCRGGECDPDYLAHLVKTRWFHQRLASATRGVGARRERIRPEMLLGIEIPFPDLAGQKAALKSIEHLTRAQSLTNQLAPHVEALLPSLLDRIFNS
jgi:type I restriction enzyme S subunit